MGNLVYVAPEWVQIKKLWLSGPRDGGPTGSVP